MLNAGGGNVLAVHMLNDSTASSDFLMVAELVAVIDDGSPLAIGYIAEPSPGLINQAPVFLGLLDDTNFAVGRGIYPTAFTEVITATDPGATIIYTTDGSIPSLSNGTQVAPADEFSFASGNVSINTTTTLRAIAVREGYLPTNVDTQTYLFVADVLQQDGAGLPLPPNSTSTWDYEMDPDVVNDPRYPNLESDLLNLPTISVVIPEADVWGPNGVYANPQELGSAWERACSVEVLDAANGIHYQVDGGLKLQGAGSRARTIGKKSMRLVFRKRYGNSTFDHPLWGPAGPSGIGTLVLRGSYFDSWTVHSDPSGDGITRSNALQIRTHFATVCGEAMGLPTIATNWSHLYINGQYWGIYNTHERPDKEFAELHLGGNEDDYTVLKHRPRGQSNGSAPEVSNGDLVAWNELMALMSQDASQTSVYNDIVSRIEVDSFIDYMLLNIWGGNEDWPHNNWYAIRHEPTNGPFQFYVWDPENFMFSASADRTGVSTNNSPGIIYDRLRDNAEFQLKFADHVRKQMFNGGALSVPVMQSRWQDLADEMQSPMNAEAARWGDEHTSSPYNTIDHWLPEIGYRKNTYIPARHDTVIAQLRAKNLYPATDAPDYSQHGGQVASGYQLSISNPNASGVIYYTTDGSDPRNTGGAVSGTATAYSGTIAITADVTVKARVLDGGDWSALNEADFRLAALANSSSLVVSEFSYNPAPPTSAEISAGFNDADDFEFLEIQNISSESIDLRNTELAAGITFDFSTSPITILAPGERLVVAENTAAFEFRYGTGTPLAGQFIGKLSNGGELILLREKGGSTIQQFTYGDSYPWPDSSDGQGASLVLKNAPSNPNPDVALNWRASSATGGTPGTSETIPSLPNNPNGDSDGNGQADLIDYVLSGNSTPGTVSVDSTDYLTLKFTQKVNAEAANVIVQYSE
ncbi:MAG: CotH kinase family protein, partial [Akkermansiaceae bacterium]